MKIDMNHQRGNMEPGIKKNNFELAYNHGREK